MPHNFTVSPDFAPDHMSGWFYFNTWLQRKLGTDIHLELYDTFEQQRAEMGFKALVRPVSKRDEAVIVVAADSAVSAVEDLEPGTRVATTADPDVDTIGMIMLEPADLDADSVQKHTYNSHVLIAKSILNGEADVCFILKQSYDELSDLIRSRLRVLVTSQISVVHHALLVGPAMMGCFEQLRDLLVAMSKDEKGIGVLENMEIRGWEPMSEEQTEFMIDLIDTLID